MNFVMPDFYPATSEIFLLVMACVILLVDLVLPPTRRWIIAQLTLLTLVGCAILTFVTADGQVVLTFSNMFVDDLLGDFLKLLVYVSVSVMLVYSRGYLIARDLDKSEFYLLVLFSTLGMMVMI